MQCTTNTLKASTKAAEAEAAAATAIQINGEKNEVLSNKAIFVGKLTKRKTKQKKL